MTLGTGTSGSSTNPYAIDMWQRLDIPMTATTYNSPYSSPTTYSRCSVVYTLHYNNADRTPVTSTKYLFNTVATPSVASNTPTQLSLQWNDGTFNDYFVVRSQVKYTRTGVDVVVSQNEAFVYVTVSNPCLITNGAAITPQIIPDINYWIKATKSTTTLNLFADAPTTRDGNKTYLYLNGGNLCGSKSYEIVMADRTTNTKTAYLNLRTSTNLYIDV